MPDITVSVADAQQTALNADASTQSAQSGSTVTAAQIATGVVAGHADSLRRSILMAWWKSKTLDQQQTIHDANQ